MSKNQTKQLIYAVIICIISLTGKNAFAGSAVFACTLNDAGGFITKYYDATNNLLPSYSIYQSCSQTIEQVKAANCAELDHHVVVTKEKELSTLKSNLLEKRKAKVTREAERSTKERYPLLIFVATGCG